MGIPPASYIVEFCSGHTAVQPRITGFPQLSFGTGIVYVRYIANILYTSTTERPAARWYVTARAARAIQLLCAGKLLFNQYNYAGNRHNYNSTCEEDEFMVAADFTLYSNPINKMLYRPAITAPPPPQPASSSVSSSNSSSSSSSSTDKPAMTSASARDSNEQNKTGNTVRIYRQNTWPSRSRPIV